MRVLFVFLIVGFSLSAKAQLAFPDSSAQWVYYCGWWSWGSGNGFDAGPNERYSLLGDTIINSTVFSKLVYESSAHGPSPNTSLAEPFGAIRLEDNKVIYQGEIGGSHSIAGSFSWQLDSVLPEHLLFDFGASVGDTLVHFVNHNIDSVNHEVNQVFSVVTEIDFGTHFGLEQAYYESEKFALTILNEEVIELYEFNTSDNYETFGGLTYGLFEPLNFSFDGGCELFCFQSPEFEYNGFSWANCQNVGIDEEEVSPSACLVNSGTSISSTCSYPNSTLSIINMVGQTVAISRQGVFNYIHLPAGIYTAILQSDKERSVLKFAITK